jgi:hypothetical protein
MVKKTDQDNQTLSVETCKDFLRSKGYYVENLWQEDNVQGVPVKERYNILNKVLSSSFVITRISELIYSQVLLYNDSLKREQEQKGV